MKLLSLATTLSCASVMAVFSLGANAETLSSLQMLQSDALIPNNSVDPPQSSHTVQNQTQNLEHASGYSVFSLVKDLQITLDNLEQDLVLEDVEWYIEKFEHIDL